jgi:mannose-6-phosphate isomerase-like protein (cupin superfamily)
MMKRFLIWLGLILVFCSGGVTAITVRRIQSPEGYPVERDGEVAKNEPGPHDGGGPSTGYLFFEKAPDLKFSFRKRVLHKGAAIGYHLQKTDEVYYFTGGEGVMTINGKPFASSRDAVPTRGGASHGLAEGGRSGLTIVITFQKE